MGKARLYLGIAARGYRLLPHVLTAEGKNTDEPTQLPAARSVKNYKEYRLKMKIANFQMFKSGIANSA